MSTGYYALDHPNPNAIARGYPGFWGYVTMNYRPQVIVVHTAENLTDLDGVDLGAESIANYFQTSDRPALYHVVTDRDSKIRIVPAGLDGTIVHTAFHAAGYNSWTVGVSMAMRSADWVSMGQDDREAYMRNAAQEVALLCVQHGIPIVKKSKAEIDADNEGSWGISGHGILDPGSRSDPGAAFDWDTFLRYVREYAGVSPVPTPQPDFFKESPDMLRVLRDDNSNIWVIDPAKNTREHIFSRMDRLHEDLPSIGRDQWKQHLFNLQALGLAAKESIGPDFLWSNAPYDVIMSYDGVGSIL